MILPDTSIWIDHFKRTNDRIADALIAGQVVIHEFVQGELLCGGVGPETEHWILLQTLPRAPLLLHEEVVEFFNSRRLERSGLGWIDTHLLASAIVEGHSIMTEDRSFARIATRLGCIAR